MDNAAFAAHDIPTPNRSPPTSGSIGSLSADLSLKANKELHEKSEWRRRDVEGLRQMVISELENQPGLRPCLEEAFLLRFLRARKFDYERSMKLLLNYYTGRHTYRSDIFGNLIPSTINHLLDENLLAFLDNAVDYYGRRILVFKACNWKPEIYPFDDILKALILSMELEICNESTQVNGIVVLIDAGGLSFSHVFQHIKTAMVKKAFSCFQDCFPCRLKAIHIFNESPLIDGVLTLMKPFMTEKFRQRLFFHGSNPQSLQQHIDREALPTDFCGSSSEFSAKDWSTRLKSSEEYFKNQLTYGFVESAPSSPTHADSSPLRTVLTTYKRLCIDGLNS